MQHVDSNDLGPQLGVLDVQARVRCAVLLFLAESFRTYPTARRLVWLRVRAAVRLRGFRRFFVLACSSLYRLISICFSEFYFVISGLSSSGLLFFPGNFLFCFLVISVRCFCGSVCPARFSDADNLSNCTSFFAFLVLFVYFLHCFFFFFSLLRPNHGPSKLFEARIYFSFLFLLHVLP